MRLTRYMSLLQEEMSRILAHNISSAVRTILKITDSKTTPSFFTEPVDQLAEYLLGELGTLEKVKRFDIAVTAADFESFRGSKPMGLTTYASWILDALDCVGSSLRVDHTALGQDVGLCSVPAMSEGERLKLSSRVNRNRCASGVTGVTRLWYVLPGALPPGDDRHSSRFACQPLLDNTRPDQSYSCPHRSLA